MGKDIERREVLTFAGAAVAAFGVGLLGLDRALGNGNTQIPIDPQGAELKEINPSYYNLEALMMFVREIDAVAEQKYPYKLNTEELDRLAEVTGLDSLEVLTYLSRRSEVADLMKHTYILPDYNQENHSAGIALFIPLSCEVRPTDALASFIIYTQVFGWAAKNNPEKKEELAVAYNEMINTTPPERYPLRFNRPSLSPDGLIRASLSLGQFPLDQCPRTIICTSLTPTSKT